MRFHSLRTLLHSGSLTMAEETLSLGESTLLKALQTSLSGATENEGFKKNDEDFIRWELGACWVQHLQNPNPDKGQIPEKSEKQGNKKKNEAEVEDKEEEDKDVDLSDVNEDLKNVLTSEQQKQLKLTKTGLHAKV